MDENRSAEVYIDGASQGNPGPAGIGVVFVDGDGQPLRKFSHYLGETTNNVAEYLALLYALQDALRQGYATLVVKTDSELLARQIDGRYKVRDATLRLLYDLARHLIQGFSGCHVQHISRNQNVLADRLAAKAVKAHHAHVTETGMA